MYKSLYIRAMKPLKLLIITYLLFVSCASVPAGDTSRNALDWPGTYRCDRMTITLRSNNTYKAQVGDIEVRSSFRWDRQGRTICLNNLSAKKACKKFLVGENKLIPLNNSGKQKKEASELIKISIIQ